MATQAPPLESAGGLHVPGVGPGTRQNWPGAQVVLPQGTGWSSPPSPVHEKPAVYTPPSEAQFAGTSPT